MSSIAAAFTARARNWDRLAVVAWIIVGVVALMRAIAAWSVPLIGDEGYYWEWSRHLALGYIDHPPGVAYAIVAFSWLGLTPFAVRIGFVLCGIVATIFVALAATRLTGGDGRAGCVAALALTLTPLSSIAFGTASPDGPYLACWAFTLYAAVRAFEARTRGAFVVLGVAMGLVMLTRVFAFAELFGIAAYAVTTRQRGVWRGGLWLSFTIAFLCYVPFLLWNSTHGWGTFTFALFGRHEEQMFWLRPFVLHAVMAGAYSPGLWIAAMICLVRPRSALITWTAAPLIALITLLSIRERVEVHWMFGPYVSLCVAMGLAYVHLRARPRIIWASASAVPAFVLFPLIFIAAIAPGTVYEAFTRTGSTLVHTGPFEIFTVPSLAQDVHNIAQANDATVVTDGYGLSSTLDFYGNVPPVVIGYSAQGQESKRWFDPDAKPTTILFVDKEALVPRPGHPKDQGRPDFVAKLEQACTRVVAGPTFGYEYRDSYDHRVPARPYFTTWCYGPKPHALRILSWDPAYTK